MQPHPTNLQRRHGMPTPAHGFARLLGLCVLVLSTSLAAQAQNDFKMIRRAPGGIQPHPDITSMKRTNNGLTIQWNGFGTSFQLERQLGINGPWQAVGALTSNKVMTISLELEQALFRVGAPAPNYVGAQACADCHSESHETWTVTAHADALTTLKNIGQHNNAQCLACHTVGFGQQTGFTTEIQTPHLAGVQCESCHGPAGDHAAKPGDLNLRPVKELSAMVCGGCHTDFHHPTYDEWSTAKHSKVTPTVADYFVRYGEARMLACGSCHSGSVRLAMVKGYEDNRPVKLPTAQKASETGITCSVCHDSHGNTAHGGQLRNPTKSLMNFSYNTSTNTTFAAQYNPNVNLCGQCHNMRGATWRDTSRYPHYSVQYNVFVGQGGVEDATPPVNSKHRDNLKQCAQCHTHRHPVENPDEEHPVLTGHGFEPTIQACATCHTENNAVALKTQVQTDTHGRMLALKVLLDQWATTKANETLRAKYGALAWEYNTPGHISNPNGTAGVVGPTSAEQTVVPDRIKQARFNLYLVEQDGTHGVHNYEYTKYLLKVAENLVKAELGP